MAKKTASKKATSKKAIEKTENKKAELTKTEEVLLLKLLGKIDIETINSISHNAKKEKVERMSEKDKTEKVEEIEKHFAEKETEYKDAIAMNKARLSVLRENKKKRFELYGIDYVNKTDVDKSNSTYVFSGEENKKKKIFNFTITYNGNSHKIELPVIKHDGEKFIEQKSRCLQFKIACHELGIVGKKVNNDTTNIWLPKLNTIAKDYNIAIHKSPSALY